MIVQGTAVSATGYLMAAAPARRPIVCGTALEAGTIARPGVSTLILTLLAAALQPAPVPTGVYQALVRAAVTEFVQRSRNQFADIPNHLDSIGRPFSIVVKKDIWSGFGAVFEDGTLELRATFMVAAIGNDAFESINVGGVSTQKGSFSGQNAFGAQARVRVIDLTQEQLFVLDRPPNPEGQTFLYRAEMPGRDAKRLYDSARLVLEGQIAKLPNGKVVGCRSSISPATISSPTLLSSQDCYVGAVVTRVAFVDSSSGVVLKEWKGSLRGGSK